MSDVIGKLSEMGVDPEMVVRYMSSKRFCTFARYMKPQLEMTNFHKVYYKVLDMFAKGQIKKLIVSCPPQHGKALPVDTPVLTTEGWKRHGDLKEGDYVFGEDGLPKRVITNWGIYRHPVQRMHFADGFDVVSAREHLWKVYCDHDDHKGRVEELLETQHIFDGRHRRSPYIRCDVRLDMPERELPIDPYILGLWLGDGHSVQGVMTCSMEDVSMYDGIGTAREVKPGIARVLVDGLSKQLRLSGLIRNKHIPTEYLLSSYEQRMELLRGLMDTDGSVDKRGICEFTQKKNRLVHDVYILLRSLGFKPTEHTYTARIDGREVGEKVRLCFNPNKGEKVFKLPRKQERIDGKTRADREDKHKFFLESVEDCGEEVVNCIQVEGGMYLAGEMLIPTHNSEGSSRLLPSFMLGLNPDNKIVIGSYNADTAKGFNYDVQRIINSPQYHSVFPDSFLNTARVRMANVYKCNSEVSEMVGHSGWLRAVGRNGSLTSKSVDISILDDVYKDYNEANSGLIREQAWKWYTTVVRTRLHNDSQELIVFTRWHEDDLIGRIEQSGEKIIVLREWSDLENIPRGAWVHLNFPALKMGAPTEIDPREEGEALWEGKHSRMKLEAQKQLDPVQFECLYQGDPGSAEGRLYGEFKTWIDKSDWGSFVRRGCCIDVADTGSDYLCSITYDIYKSKNTAYNEKTHRFEPILFALVTDILFTQEGTEVTYISVPQQINAQGTQKVWVESNSGGSQFANTIEKKIRAMVHKFVQRSNKETKILTNASGVMQSIVMPFGWEDKYPKFYHHISHFLRMFKANSHDDDADTLSEIYLREIAPCNTKPYGRQRRGIRKAN